MCGIAGYVAARNAAPPDRSCIDQARRALRHRGPDGDGTFIDGPAGFCHTRLSIIDVEGGAQPVFNEDGNVLVVFNGEIWNHESLRDQLVRCGHSFRTRSDTEVLVHAWEEWREEMLERLSGMFAFALWDKRREHLVLARDPAGKKPLYLALGDEGVAFGSDCRSVLLVTGQDAAVNEEAVAGFLFRRYAVSPETLFRGIERLEPGHLLSYDRSTVARRRYWKPESWPVEPLDPSELRPLLREAVRARLMSDVPLGIALSGGVDSSAVLGLAREAGAQGIDTFTIGFSDPLYDERKLARLAAERHGARHHEIEVSPKSFVDALPRLAWYRDEPLAEPSEIPLLLLAEFAAQKVKVVLGGDGGDELFAGYPKYRAERLLRLLGWLPRPMLSRLVSTASGLRRTHRRMGRAAETLLVRDELLRWASWFRSFTPAEIERLLDPRLAADAQADELVGPLASKLALYRDVDPGRRMLLADFLTYLPDNMLLRADKVLMGASIEGRVPLLDQSVVRRVSLTPLRNRTGWRTGKSLLRDAVRDLLPPELVRAPKKGFAVPVAALLLREDPRLIESVLLSERALSRGILRPDAVRAIVHDPARRVVERELKLFTLLSLELWLRACVDSVSLEPPTTWEDLVDERRLAASGG